MKRTKSPKSYDEVEDEYLAQINKIEKEMLDFTAKQEKEKGYVLPHVQEEEKRDFLAKHEKKKLKIEDEHAKAIAKLNPQDVPFSETIINTENIGDY